MKKLSMLEIETFQMFLDRAIVHEQLGVGVSRPDGAMIHLTTELSGDCVHNGCIVIFLRLSGLKELWVRYHGSKGGLAKARNAKKRKVKTNETQPNRGR